MNDKKGDDQASTRILWLIGAVAAAVVLYRIYLRVELLYFQYRVQVLLIGGALAVLGTLLLIAYLYNKAVEFTFEKNEATASNQIQVGISEATKKPIYISEEARTYHTQVIGSTGSGKTEGITLPWIFDDIEKGRGLIIVDGKPEEHFLKRVYGKVLEEGRGDDFQLFSLAKPSQSFTFNPLGAGDSTEICERVFSSFSTDNSYYSSVQFSGLNSVLKLIQMAGRIPKPGLVRELLKNKNLLSAWANQVSDPNLYAELEPILALPNDKFQENFSGLTAYFENFTKSTIAPLLNQDRSEIDFENVLLTKKIVYFQLPTLSSKTLASTLGKLVIQSFAGTVGKLQGSGSLDPKKLFSVYLDDFNDYIYQEFSSVAAKVRSGGVGIVFAHQSLADLNKVSPEFKDAIIENTNNKIILNVNDPESADFFSRYAGTKQTEKTTERRTKVLFGTGNTGEQSVRTTEEFLVHPNVFKSGLKALEGIAILKSPSEVKKTERIRCVPVNPTKSSMPPNRTYPAVHFVAEARMFGDQKDPSQPVASASQKPQFHGKSQTNRGNENEGST